MTEVRSPSNLAFGCVAEPTPRFYEQVLRLVQSIRWFGGSLADADVFVCFVGDADVARRAELEALGAQVRAVEPFNPLNRYSNKIRFLELPELAGYQTAVLLDCDMALVQDPAPYLAQPALQLMIADLPTVPSERLAWLCGRFGLAAPAPTYRTTCSQEPTIWYCNTGVTILPCAWIARILPAWRDFILRLCAEPALLDPPYNHCNQAAMTLTYIADPLPFAELPVAMNFPLHQIGRRPAEALLREDPVILHYHDRVDAEGLLLAVPYPLAQARVEQLNERLRASRRLQPAADRTDQLLAQSPASLSEIAKAPRHQKAGSEVTWRLGGSLPRMLLERAQAPANAADRASDDQPAPTPPATEAPQLPTVRPAFRRTRPLRSAGRRRPASLRLMRRSPMPRRVVVCITGMHRSGTSLIAQILHRSGPYLGPYRQLAQPAADNLDGYWEHPDFQQLNDDILTHFGGGWDLAPSFPAGWADLPELEPLRQRARALIRQFDGQQFWGWKDPRSALTIPFWRSLIPDLKVVICVRNPLEVAQSLSRRGMSSRSFGLRLWQTYYERLLASTAPQDWIVTHYDTYFVDALAETKRVLSWLGIPASTKIIRRAGDAVSDELRHQRDTAAGLLEVEAPSAVLQLYGRLCEQASAPDGAALANLAAEPTAEASDTRPAALAARLAGAIALLREHEAALTALTTTQTELAVLQPVLQAREAEVAFLQPALAAREAEIAGFTRELLAAHELLVARETEIADFTHALASMRELLAAREVEIADFTHALASMREVLAAREAEIADFTRELDSTRELLVARESEIADFAHALALVREQHEAEPGETALHNDRSIEA
jgi:hypothetical protein